MDDKQKMIGRIARNSTCSVIVSVLPAASGTMIDIRQYFEAADGPRPSTRGVRLPMRDAQRLADLIQTAITEGSADKSSEGDSTDDQ
jgi:hypothetical protein